MAAMSSVEALLFWDSAARYSANTPLLTGVPKSTSIWFAIAIARHIAQVNAFKFYKIADGRLLQRFAR